VSWLQGRGPSVRRAKAQTKGAAHALVGGPLDVTVRRVARQVAVRGHLCAEAGALVTCELASWTSEVQDEAQDECNRNRKIVRTWLPPTLIASSSSGLKSASVTDLTRCPNCMLLVVRGKSSGQRLTPRCGCCFAQRTRPWTPAQRRTLPHARKKLAAATQ